MSEYRQRARKSVPSYPARNFVRTRGKGHGPDGRGLGCESVGGTGIGGGIGTGGSFCGTRKARSTHPTSLWGAEWESSIHKRHGTADPSLYCDHDPLIQGRTKNVVPTPTPRPYGIKRVSHDLTGPLTSDMVVHGKRKLTEPSSMRDHSSIIPQSLPSGRITTSREEYLGAKLQREPLKSSSIVPRPIPTGGVFPEAAPHGRRTQRAFGSSEMRETLSYASAGKLRSETMFTPRSSSTTPINAEVLSARKENEQMYRQFRARQNLSSSSLREHLYDTPIPK